MIDAELFNSLDKVFTKKTLELGMLPLVKKFFILPGNHEYCRPDIAEIMQKLVNRKTITKNEALQFCLSVFENEVIYKGFKESLPDPIQILIETLLWRDSISNKEAEKLLKQPITFTNNLNRSYMVEEELINEYYFFSVNKEMNYGQKPSFTLSINMLLKRVLVAFYPRPKYYDFISLKNIPATDFIFSAENRIELELQMMLPYYHQNGIKYSSKGRPLEGSLNKLQRAVNITEFFPEEIGFSAKTRTMLMAGLLYDINPTDINIDSISLLKTLINQNYAKHNTADFILLHLKGWGYLTDMEHHINVEAQFLKIVRQFPADGKWISMKNLEGYIESRFIDLKPIEKYALGYRLYFETPTASQYYKVKTNIYRDSYHLVNDPFIKGSVFLFAAMGLMEIAYDGVDTEEFPITFSSEYDNLRYMRLTPLGAYILGLSDHYTPTHEHTKNKMTLQEDSLMILTEGDIAVHELTLAKFAEKAGGNRFKVTASLFLKDCHSHESIGNKITLFRQIVREKLPAFWETQFQTWLSNAVKLQEDITTKLFKIPANDKNLQRIIVTDDVLKKIILKAEKFYILVPSSKVSIFKSRMKELGYVIE